MRKEKKKEEGERIEKVDQETWKKMCGVSYVLLSVVSKVIRVIYFTVIKTQVYT